MLALYKFSGVTAINFRSPFLLLLFLSPLRLHVSIATASPQISKKEFRFSLKKLKWYFYSFKCFRVNYSTHCYKFESWMKIIDSPGKYSERLMFWRKCCKIFFFLDEKKKKNKKRAEYGTPPYSFRYIYHLVIWYRQKRMEKEVMRMLSIASDAIATK